MTAVDALLRMIARLSVRVGQPCIQTRSSTTFIATESSVRCSGSPTRTNAFSAGSDGSMVISTPTTLQFAAPAATVIALALFGVTIRAKRSAAAAVGVIRTASLGSVP